MASELIGALRVTLGLNSASFEAGTKRAISQMNKVEAAGFATGRALRGLVGIAFSVGWALAGMISVQSVRTALEYAGSIAQVSRQLGVTTTELQTYRYAATQLNLTTEEMERGLGKLTLAIGKAAAGAKTQGDVFRKLGIDIKDADGNIRSTGDVLLELADKLSRIPDPARRAAAVVAVFGEEGRKLVPLLENGSAGLKKFAEDAEEAGLVLTEGEIAKADETARKIEALTHELKVDFSREVAQNADSIYTLVSALKDLVVWFGKAGAAYVNFSEWIGKKAGNFIAEQAMAGNTTMGSLAGLIMRFRGNGRQRNAATPAQQPTGPAVDVSDLLASGGRRRTGRAARDRTSDIREQIDDLRKGIETAFRRDQIPEATREADRLRERLDDIADSARKAGVPMGQFAGEVAVLTARIAELEQEGLAREARDFSREVENLARDLEDLDTQALQPINRQLLEVDDRFDALRQAIFREMEANAALATQNEDAARTMQNLVNVLGQVSAARDRVKESIKAQFRAEQELADVRAAQAESSILNDLEDLNRARGTGGLMTRPQEEMRNAERALNDERIAALAQLRELEVQRAKAEADNDQLEMTRLDGIIELQREYYDLVTQTSAQQLVNQTRLQTAYQDFADGLTNALYDFVTTGEWSFKKLGNMLLQVLNEALLKPAIGDLVGGLLKGIGRSNFAGGFYTGGVIPKGQWGIVGERGPEPIFAADGPLRVLPNESLGAGSENFTFNINVSGAMSDAAARRTGSQIGAAAARQFSTARKSGIAG